MVDDSKNLCKIRNVICEKWHNDKCCVINANECSFFNADQLDALGKWDTMRMGISLNDKRKRCQLCNHLTVTYEKNLNCMLVRLLATMYKKYGKNNPIPRKFVVDTVTSGASDLTKLKYWELIYPTEDRKWYVTDKGEDFLKGKIMLPIKVWVYHDTITAKPYDKEEPSVMSAISICQLPKEKFDLDAYMKETNSIKFKNEAEQLEFA